MPQRDPTPDDAFWCGRWPVTVERIRDWQRAFKGAPSRRVPFGAHAVKYLLHLLEKQAGEGGVEAFEQAHGNQDPSDAPWITRPRTGHEWRHRYDPSPPAVGENANPIPPDVDPPDHGTDLYPEWEQYQERRHEDGAALTTREREDERRLREREDASSHAPSALDDFFG